MGKFTNEEEKAKLVKSTQTAEVVGPSLMSRESVGGEKSNQGSDKKIVYLIRKNSLSGFSGDASGSTDGNLDGKLKGSVKAGSDFGGFLGKYHLAGKRSDITPAPEKKVGWEIFSPDSSGQNFVDLTQDSS
jgi:hypothetical protein